MWRIGHLWSRGALRSAGAFWSRLRTYEATMLCDAKPFQSMYQTLRNANSVSEYVRCFAALAVCMAGAGIAYALGTTVLTMAQ